MKIIRKHSFNVLKAILSYSSHTLTAMDRHALCLFYSKALTGLYIYTCLVELQDFSQLIIRVSRLQIRASAVIFFLLPICPDIMKSDLPLHCEPLDHLIFYSIMPVSFALVKCVYSCHFFSAV